jgi:hypothetical protein
MSVQSARSLLRRALALSRNLAPAVMLGAIIMEMLAGCGASPSVARPTPLQVVSAAVTMTPSDYKGACSGKQDVTFTAQLSANPNNLGGEVHYRWRIGYSVSDGVITFEKGEVAKTLTRAISYDIVPEADPYLAVAFATTQPNVVAAPETRFDVSCSVPLRITDVSVTMQPWTANCGPHAFGFAAVLTAPAHNVGGEARYIWRFGTGAPQSGKVIFAPGQTTQTVVASQTYNIQRSALVAPGTGIGTGMAADAGRTATAPQAPKATPTPSPTPDPKPTQPPSPWPKAGPGQVYAVFSVTAPNAISNNAWATIYC